MRTKLNSGIVFITLAVVMTILAGCRKDDPYHEPTPEEVNSYVLKAMRSNYLWNNSIPSSINEKTEADPLKLFELLRYKASESDWKDSWSFISDNAAQIVGNMSKSGLSYGCSLVWSLLNGKQDQYFGIVDFVYENSPAEKAGMSRGDIVLTFNGGPITAGNYLSVLNSPQAELGMGEVSGGTVVSNGKTVTLKAEAISQNPIVKTEIFENGGKKTGYIFYSDYVDASTQSLQQVITGFKNAGVSELIFDLRSNGGGESVAAEFLCDMLAPANVVASNKLMYSKVANGSGVEDQEDAEVYFGKSKASVNLGLSRIYFLTSKRTASASELTITSLQPYMEVILIGSNTNGKFCGGRFFPAPYSTPDMTFIHDDSEIGNWLTYIITFKYANSAGYTDFYGGISPDHNIPPNWLDLHPLGDENDPLIKAALTHIGTGAFPAAPAETNGMPPVRINDNMASRANVPFNNIMYSVQ